MKNLVIVESPTKARTISRFLGSDFVVDSSYGHIRDLPSSTLGVDVEHNFEPHYIIPAKARATVKRLKEETKKADTVILATDEDREGEAIAWHLAQALGLDSASKKPTGKSSASAGAKKRVKRIVFHEITRSAIERALKDPRDIDFHRVDSQQARRILDRLVGYKLSPFLWKKVYRGLSAGRVQSVAVRLVVEREREVGQFKPEEYWTIVASLAKQKGANTPFEATLAKRDGEALDKFAVKTKEDADRILNELDNASWSVSHVETKAASKNPSPPFTTSTLQQDGFRRLGFSAKQTMRLAQQLYEGVEIGAEGSLGLITYMRTDSLNLSEDALAEARKFISREFGHAYLLPASRHFKTTTKGAQEAHEAIRPTDPARTPESIAPHLDRRSLKLYELIWRRFIATQMPPAVFDRTAADIEASRYTFRATGQVMKFDGFLKVYPLKISENELPELSKGEMLALRALLPNQHFTEPPPRYSEASLIKILEQNGIGRPSTYAPTISTIQDRGYVEKFERRYLKPTETGFLVNDLLVEHFPEIVDLQFTATMESEFDEIAEGKKEWQPVIRAFYEPFAKQLKIKYEEVKKLTMDEPTNEICERCGKPMVIKMGRFGKFLACSGFPECKNTKTLKEAPQAIDMKCPKCVEGDVIIRRTKRGKLFYGCSRYPACDWASWTDPRLPEENKKKEEK